MKRTYFCGNAALRRGVLRNFRKVLRKCSQVHCGTSCGIPRYALRNTAERRALRNAVRKIAERRAEYCGTSCGILRDVLRNIAVRPAELDAYFVACTHQCFRQAAVQPSFDALFPLGTDGLSP
ncbi:hypothetical protein Bbelb_269890 [Branchiostoma belcheri]|nr:hypothetical protein Bbelb_269890 [Branchiostoma belcheri]